MLDVATDLGIVKKSGAWFYLGDERLGQGRENAKTFLKHNPDVMNSIKQQIMGGAPEISGRLAYAGIEETASSPNPPASTISRSPQGRVKAGTVYVSAFCLFQPAVLLADEPL